MSDDEPKWPDAPNLPTLASAALDIASDVMSIADLTLPSQTTARLLGGFRQRKIEEARAVLLEQLRKGEVSDYHAALQDDMIAIIYRYYLAAAQGRARRNLHLLSQAIVGQAKREQLFADEFHTYARSLEDLTRDEVLILASLYRHWAEANGTSPDGVSESTSFWANVVEDLVPRPFGEPNLLRAVAMAAVRTGLVGFEVVGGGMGGVTLTYFHVTRLMTEIAELVDFEEALAEERRSA